MQLTELTWGESGQSRIQNVLDAQLLRRSQGSKARQPSMGHVSKGNFIKRGLLPYFERIVPVCIHAIREVVTAQILQSLPIQRERDVSRRFD